MRKIIIFLLLIIFVLLLFPRELASNVKDTGELKDFADYFKLYFYQKEDNTSNEESRIDNELEAATDSEDTESFTLDSYIVTAYTAGYESTGKTPDHPLYGITASGEMVEEGVTIACPKELEFGTQIYIEYFDNVFTCLDRGGAIKGKRLDVYMESLDEALKFGKRELEIKIMY